MMAFSFNSEDQLIAVRSAISIITYKYNALGRRTEKNVGGTITRYIYDGEDIIQELDGNNTLVATYTQGPGVDEPISIDKGGQKYYYISDGIGSVTALVDVNGNVAQTYRYNSFGNIIDSTGTISQPFTYTGREFDSETGLYYYRARYYDPHTGRFLQEDPVWSSNLYKYCANNPLKLVDPWGLKEYIFVSQSLGGGYGIWAGEAGVYLIIDPSAGEVYKYAYISGGVGLGFGGAYQNEVGVFDYEGDPCNMPDWSWSVSAFAAGPHGMSFQTTSPTGNSWLSYKPSRDSGLSGGYALGAGAGISGMRSRSWFIGKEPILPSEIKNLLKKK